MNPASPVQRFTRNAAGRDIAVGDIHGCFSQLEAALDDIGFDRRVDRLFSVGDVVDRGPECERAAEWLSSPWFHAVRGNHEDLAIRYAAGNPIDFGMYITHGGGWFVSLSPERRRELADAFAALPIAIEVETADGVVGLVHADCPKASWPRLVAALESPLTRGALRRTQDACMWSRDRLTADDRSGVKGVRAVVVGHTPVEAPVVLGNVFHIDTGGWTPEGHFTLLDLATLQAAPARQDSRGLG